MDNFNVFKTIHFPEEWGKRIPEMYQKQYNLTKGGSIFRNVVHMNQDPKHHFFILGLLDGKVIASLFVSTFIEYTNDGVIENFDEYLISSLIVDKDYQRKGFGTRFLSSAIKILQEENASKIVAFACDNSKKLFENFNFKKNPNKKEFGSTIPADDTDVYYELNLPSNFFLSPLDKEDVKFVAMSMMKEFRKYYKHTDDEPIILLPHTTMYEQTIMHWATKDNALVKTIRCNRMAIGYAHMYYEDYDDDFGNSEHSINLNFYLDENYLYKSAIKAIIDETIEFSKFQQKNHNLECIKVYLNKYSILMKRYDFYKRCFLELGFKQESQELFTLSI